MSRSGNYAALLLPLAFISCALLSFEELEITSDISGHNPYFNREYLGVCGALPENCINLQFIANLYLANSQRSPVNRNFCMNMQ
ncbi:MAG: hypothetical protein LBQ88_15135, partial [Treponema sp.]|nr:hypothetical protein [Treponema sp.]